MKRAAPLKVLDGRAGAWKKVSKFLNRNLRAVPRACDAHARARRR
jgi:hypothetical protein